MLLGSCFLSLSSCQQFMMFHQPLWMMLSSRNSMLSCRAPSAKPEEHLCALGSVVAVPWSVLAVSVFKVCPLTFQSWGLALGRYLGNIGAGLDTSSPSLSFLRDRSLSQPGWCSFCCRHRGPTWAVCPFVLFLSFFTFHAAVKADNSSSLLGNVLRSVG